MEFEIKYLIKFDIKIFNEIQYKIFHKTALCIAIEKENIEIVKLLLMNEKLDINLLNIFKI